MSEEALHEKMELLLEKVSDRLSGSIYGLMDYTGAGMPLGNSSMYDSPLCANQLVMALVMSNDPLIDELIADEELFDDNFDPKPLIDARVLQGMKILDLGCGYRPSFARCSRKMGAEVHTVDVISADQFFYLKGFFDDKDREEEVAYHIMKNLKDKDALDKIIERTGANFDLVTSAHLETGVMHDDGKNYYPPTNIEEIAFSLLKKQGIYYNANRMFAKRKE